jgi:hypothetical protein
MRALSKNQNPATGAVYVAGDLVLKGKGNRFTDNLAGHHDADVYVDEGLGGRVLREDNEPERLHQEGQREL